MRSAVGARRVQIGGVKVQCGWLFGVGWCGDKERHGGRQEKRGLIIVMGIPGGGGMSLEMQGLDMLKPGDWALLLDQWIYGRGYARGR